MNIIFIINEEMQSIIDEAFIAENRVKTIFAKLNIDFNNAKKIGEGDNGIAYLYNNIVIKVTTDSAEAEFSGVINGHKLDRVANVYDIYEFDFGGDSDNKIGTYIGYGSKYYWVIFKEYIPYGFMGNNYYNILVFFDNYVAKNFDFSSQAFDRMIEEYRNEHIEMMSDDEYDPDEDYELNDDITMLEYFKELHMELQPLGILSVSDMKSSNMGTNEDGEPVWLELHIWKDGGYATPKFKIINI